MPAAVQEAGFVTRDPECNPKAAGYGDFMGNRRGTSLARAIGTRHMSTVLFVSHDADLCAVAARILPHAGHEVTTAAHAGHATLACAKRDFDVLVVENQMPDGSGREVIDRIRRYCPGVQVVRLCDPVSTIVGSGIAVVRPFTSDDLLDAVIESAANAAVVIPYIRRGATTR